MTEYELLDVTFSAVNSATNSWGMIFSVICGYLVVAWLIGEKLTRAQVTLVNLLFLCSAPMLIWGWLGRYLIALDFQNRLLELNPQAVERVSIYVITGMPIILSILVLGSLKFMWDVRHPKTE